VTPPRRTLVDYLLHPTLVLSVYCLAAVIATIVKLAPGEFIQNGFHYQPLQNFAIFRNSFFHLIHHQNLYAQFQFEQWDFYRYSPAFALLFAPFALLPYALGSILWNLVNAAALFFAVRSAPVIDDRRKMLALWFIFLAMLNSIQNAQSNALMAALIIAAWSAHEREKSDLSGLLITLATFIKLFGVFALLPCLLKRGRKQLIAFTAAWGAIFALAPLFLVSFRELGLLYRNWYATVIAFNQARLGISFMGFLKAWLHLDLPSNFVVAAGAIVLIAVPLLRRDAPRILVLASVLIFVTIFNYAAESPTYVIAVTGVALWYFAQARTATNLALLIATFLLSMLSSTDLFPRALRREYLEPYVIKALPCILVWLKLQWDLIRFPKTNALS
jgi:hypothetical protein